MATPTFTKAGVKATTPTKLDKTIFAAEIKSHQLLKDVYQSYLDNGRLNLAVTKTRGLVSGGGKKPWKQKGTGRARFGSSRVPIWRGGGITFGPTGKENYTKKVNVKAKRTAIRQALTLATQSNKVIIIESFDSKDGKVKSTVAFLDKVGAKRNILLVVDNKDSLVERATRNIADLKATQARYLNVYDLLNADSVVITKEALVIITDWLGDATPKKVAKEKVTK